MEMQELAMIDNDMPERGIHRDSVAWPVHWDDGYKHSQLGEIRDISSGGVFLRPAWKLTEHICTGDTMRLRCWMMGRQYNLIGTVRWMGSSHRHACYGVGLEIDGSYPSLEGLLGHAKD